ncbi:MAG: hypothetical protein M3O61_15790 [Gemmatimonadota bacterium]|nr:hypothetical protein [Gemmatimonadota bacterium]
MTKTGIDTVALQAAIIPALGVVPPSKSAWHSSNRRAPPSSAALRRERRRDGVDTGLNEDGSVASRHDLPLLVVIDS